MVSFVIGSCFLEVMVAGQLPQCRNLTHGSDRESNQTCRQKLSGSTKLVLFGSGSKDGKVSTIHSSQGQQVRMPPENGCSALGLPWGETRLCVATGFASERPVGRTHDRMLVGLPPIDELPQRANSGIFTEDFVHGKNHIMTTNHSVVAIYGSHAEAETAVKELEKSGYDLKKLSIIGRDTHTEEHVVGFYNAGDRMKYWGGMGAFWGWIWGIFFGSAFFLIPGIGPLMVAGPLVGWIVGALEGAVVVGGLSALGAGLVSLGIPEDSILQYETALKTDKFILIAHGSADDVANAKAILQGTHSESLDIHQPSMSA